MSQVGISQPIKQNLTDDPSLDHYRNNMLEPRSDDASIHQELQNAKPVSRSSGWKLAGRIALGIVTGGLSEIVRLAYRGIKSCCSSSRPAEAPEPRVRASAKGVPAADPEISQQNSTLASALQGRKPLPQAYKDCIDSMMNDLRAKYGEQIIPEGTTLKNLVSTIGEKVDPRLRQELYFEIADSKEAISPAELPQFIKQRVLPSLNLMVLTSIAEEHAKQIGGMGGLDMADVLNNLLIDQTLKARLHSAADKAEILKFADDNKIRQTITEYRQALNGALDSLRSKFGSEKVPQDLAAALSLKIEGQSLVRMLRDKFRHSTKSIGTLGLRKTVQNTIAGQLLQQTLEKALSEKAKNMGVPLNRRSCVLLVRSQLRQPEIFNALNNTADPEALNNAVNTIGLENLLKTQKENVERLFATHSPRVAEELKSLLRTFIEGFSYAPSDVAASEEKVADMVNRMKGWKNLSGSDPNQQPLNDVFKQGYATDLSKLEGSGEDTRYINNIYQSMIFDTIRSTFIINDQVIPRENAEQKLPTTVKNAVPDPKDQQMISKLINQRMWGNLISASSAKLLPNGGSLDNLPGGNLIPSTEPGSSPIMEDAKHTATYSLTVSHDKKTALVTGTLFQQLKCDDQKIDGNSFYFGGVKFTMNFKLNLNANENGQGLVDFTLGQEFIPSDKLNSISRHES